MEFVAKELDQTPSIHVHLMWTVEHGSISDAVVLLASCARLGNLSAQSAQMVFVSSQVN